MSVRLHAISEPLVAGRLIYVGKDHGFEFHPSERQEIDCDLMVRKLSLATDSETGLIAYVWGYSPRISWIPASLHTPAGAHAQRLAVDDPASLLPGAGKILHPHSDWQPLFDQSSSILELRLKNAQVSDWYWIATGTLIGLDADRLIVALQLHADFAS